MVIFAADKGPQHVEPFTVKNTFIEVGNDFFEDDGLEDSFQAFQGKRQVSEPAFIWGRQASSRTAPSRTTPQPGLGVLKETPTEEGLPVMEEPELVPLEPAQVPTPSTMAPISPLPLTVIAPQPSDSSGCEEPETESEPLPTDAEVVAAGLAEDTYAPGEYDPMHLFQAMPSAASPGAIPWGQPATCSPWPEKYDSPAASMGYPTQDNLLNPSGQPLRGNSVVPSEWREVLTVMMRNLPNRYTQQMLFEEISSSGFGGTFDYFYLPIDPETQANKGYAFINFIHPETSWRFKAMFEGKQMARFNSSKFVSVSPAALQGLEANYAHYSTARCSRGEPAARPIFLREPAQSGSLGKNANRRGGQRRRNNGRSLVDVAAQKQREQHQTHTMQPPQHLHLHLQQTPQMLQMQLGSGMSFQRPLPPQDPQSQGAPGQSMVAKFCPYCGGSVMPKYRFCQYCGAAQAKAGK